MPSPKKFKLVADVNFNDCEGYFLTLSANPCNGELVRMLQDRQPSMNGMTLNPLSSMNLIGLIR